MKKLLSIVSGKKQPIVESVQQIKECGAMPMASSTIPSVPPVSMNVNMNAQGVDQIKELLNLMNATQATQLSAPAPLPMGGAPMDMPQAEKDKKPDVVFMIYDPKGEMDIKEQRFDKESYDQAKEYRDSFLGQTEVKQVKKEVDEKEIDAIRKQSSTKLTELNKKQSVDSEAEYKALAKTEAEINDLAQIEINKIIGLL